MKFTDKDIADMKAKAKELGINVGNKSPETLYKELSEAENAPKEATPVDPAVEMEARIMAMVNKRLAEKDAEIEELKKQASTNLYAPINDAGNPRVMLYKKGKQQQFHPDDVSGALADGWFKSPADIPGHIPMKPNPSIGDMVEGKVHRG